MSFSFRNLQAPENLAIGVGEFAGIVPKSDVTTIAVPTAPFTNPGDENIIATQHTFAAGRGFAKWLLAPETNKLEGKPTGDKGNQTFIWRAEIFVPGSYAEMHEQVGHLLNVPCLVIIPDSNCSSGLYYHLGSSCAFAYAQPEFMTGTTKDGRKGWMVPFEYTGPKLLIYAPAGGPTWLA